MNNILGGTGKKASLIIPQISGYSSRKEWEEACWQEILRSGTFQSLTTASERHNIVMRAAAMEGIASGKSYRQISKELFLSLQTISGIKKAISEKTYRSYAERSKKERKRKPKRKFYRTEHKPARRTKYGRIPAW